jgi:hypothetical protein
VELGAVQAVQRELVGLVRGLGAGVGKKVTCRL